MTFEHNGQRYRIGFKHDRSRRWVDHFNHEVRLVRQIRGAEARPAGEAFLYCAQCELRLSHLSRAERARNVHCTIWVQNGVHCEGGKEYPVWDTRCQGQSHLNVQAGDQYDREKGRVAALRNALELCAQPANTPAFRAALWTWFLHGRKRSAVERALAKANTR